MKIERFFVENGAKQLVNYINSQPDDSIQSLDVFCHGNLNGLYFHLGAKRDKDTDGLYSNLYRNFNEMISDVTARPKVDYIHQYRIWSLDLVKFTKNCKIEIHGCSTASTLDPRKPNVEVLDNFCQIFSQGLQEAGRTDGVVIGHRSKANPLINGSKTTLNQQDYRHGERAIYHNGTLKLITNEKGRIMPNTIKQAIQTNTLIRRK